MAKIIRLHRDHDLMPYDSDPSLDRLSEAEMEAVLRRIERHNRRFVWRRRLEAVAEIAIYLGGAVAALAVLWGMVWVAAAIAYALGMPGVGR